MALDAAPRAEVFSLDAAPKAQVFSLKTPLLSSGRTTLSIAGTDLLKLAVKVHAQGGENGLHTHQKEDHAFVVMQGQATFHDGKGTETVVNKYEGILLPRGAFYNFQATGDENLVLLRVSSSLEGGIGDFRVGPNGRPLTLEENKKPPNTTVIPGQFFGA